MRANLDDWAQSNSPERVVGRKLRAVAAVATDSLDRSQPVHKSSTTRRGNGLPRHPTSTRRRPGFLLALERKPALTQGREIQRWSGVAARSERKNVRSQRAGERARSHLAGIVAIATSQPSFIEPSRMPSAGAGSPAIPLTLQTPRRRPLPQRSQNFEPGLPTNWRRSSDSQPARPTGSTRHGTFLH